MPDGQSRSLAPNLPSKKGKVDKEFDSLGSNANSKNITRESHSNGPLLPGNADHSVGNASVTGKVKMDRAVTKISRTLQIVGTQRLKQEAAENFGEEDIVITGLKKKQAAQAKGKLFNNDDNKKGEDGEDEEWLAYFALKKNARSKTMI